MGESDPADSDDSPRQNSILTTQQRKFLAANVSNTSNSTTTRARIRERVREGIRDFRWLATELEDRDRELIFPDPDLKGYEAGFEFKSIQRDVGHAIAFMYAGLGGGPGFRQPFREGVQNGEKILGTVEHPTDVEPRFSVDFLSHVDLRDAVNRAEAGEWDRLSERSRRAVIQLAENTDAIDFDAIHSALDRHEEASERLDELQEEATDGSDRSAE